MQAKVRQLQDKPTMDEMLVLPNVSRDLLDLLSTTQLEDFKLPWYLISLACKKAIPRTMSLISDILKFREKIISEEKKVMKL